MIEHIITRKKLHEVDHQNPKLLGLTAVELNITELCNRTCSFCPRSNPDIYPNKNLHMSISTAQKIKQDLLDAKYKGLVHICGFGEPLLHNNFLNLLSIFSKDFHLAVTTNGDRLLNGYYTPQDLQETGLSRLFVDSYDGEDQFKSFEELLVSYSSYYKIRKVFDTGSPLLTQQFMFNNRGGLISGQKNSNFKNPCYLPMYKILIDWNGDVILCCNNWSRLKPHLGNINLESLVNIWNSEKLCDVRKNLLKGQRQKYPACKNCNVKGTAIGAASADQWSDLLFNSQHS